MIPRIKHGRSRLCCHLNDYEDGAHTLFVSADTYPELFDLRCAAVASKAPKGWRNSATGKMRYLWFPPSALTEEDLGVIGDWQEHFEQYVLVGRNRNLEPHFTDELDFCLALDYKYEPGSDRRTCFGEAEYQLKYHHSLPHFGTLRAAVREAIGYLPVPEAARKLLVLTTVPAERGSCSVPDKLARAVAHELGFPYLRADLLCDKSAMKGLRLEDKIPEWERLYGRPECVALSGEVGGRVMVVIDDLYQSGATLWCYARYLKRQGAKHVLGLPCVKSLRDTDNQ